MAHVATKPAAKREAIQTAERPPEKPAVEVSANVETSANGSTEKGTKVRYYHPLLSAGGDMTKKSDDAKIAAGANFADGLSIEPSLVFSHSGKKIIKLDSSDFARPQELAQVLADVFQRAADEQKRIASLSDADIAAQLKAAELTKSIGKKLRDAKDSGMDASAVRNALEDMLKNLGLA